MCGFQNTSRPQGPSLLPAPSIRVCNSWPAFSMGDPTSLPLLTRLLLYTTTTRCVQPRDPSCGCIGVDMEKETRDPICFCFVLSLVQASRVLWMSLSTHEFPLGCSRATTFFFVASIRPQCSVYIHRTVTQLLKRESNVLYTLHFTLLAAPPIRSIRSSGPITLSDLCPPSPVPGITACEENCDHMRMREIRNDHIRSTNNNRRGEETRLTYVGLQALSRGKTEYIYHRCVEKPKRRKTALRYGE